PMKAFNVLKIGNFSSASLRVRFLILTALVILPLSGIAQTCIAPPTGLVSWWPGEANAYDIVGVNNGTVHPGVTFGTGKVGQAFSFNGTSGYVSIPASGPPPPPGGPPPSANLNVGA